jgi:hypothetical protein
MTIAAGTIWIDNGTRQEAVVLNRPVKTVIMPQMRDPSIAMAVRKMFYQ